MSWLNKVHSWFTRENRAAGVTDELRFHLEKEIESNIAKGMSAQEARRQALIAFGGVQQTREKMSEISWRHFPESVIQDVRFGFRMLVKYPGFTLAAVLTLALGIGANAYVFSTADALLLRPLPFPHLDRLMTLFNGYRSGDVGRHTSPADFLDWKRQASSFEELSAFSGVHFNLTGGDSPEKVTAAAVSANFFSTLAVTPILGRAFAPDEEFPGHEQVVVLSYGLWNRRYGSDPAVLGRNIQLNGRPYEVIGVLDKKVDFPTVDLWTPLTWSDQFSADRKAGGVEVVGRLKPGISLDRARAEMKGIAQQLAAAYPATEKDKSIEVRPLRLVVNGTMTLPITEALALAAALVLLLACANVAGLLIARGVARQKEMAVRAALGAMRRRLIRQLLAENALLAGLGCVTALALAKWAVSAQLATFSPLFMRLVSGLDQMSVDLRAFIFMLVITMLCVVAFGIVPALGTTRLDLNVGLREGGQSSASGSRHRLRSVMVVLQVAMALALLAGAMLMGRGFRDVERVAQSFEPEHVLTFSLDLPNSRYSDSSQQARLVELAVSRIQTIPGVNAAAAFTSTPFSNNGVYWMKVRPLGQTSSKTNELPGGIIQSVSPGFLETMHVPLMRGRDFTPQDKNDGLPVAIISERLARRFFGSENPVGKTLQLEEANVSSPWLTVVGVAHDVLYDWTNQVPEFTVYRPVSQAPRPRTQFALRAGANPLSLVPQVRKEIAAIDPDLPVSDPETLADAISDGVTPLKWIGSFVEVLGILALVLAVVGVYGVMANAVSERIREIGIRMALGANRNRIITLLLRRSMLLTLAGIALGWPMAITLARMLASISYGVPATESLMLLVCAVILFVVALLACVIPARRASKIDPLEALRYE